jgi:hydrogenase-4 membrane subunit HyfE
VALIRPAVFALLPLVLYMSLLMPVSVPLLIEHALSIVFVFVIIIMVLGARRIHRGHHDAGEAADHQAGTRDGLRS